MTEWKGIPFFLKQAGYTIDNTSEGEKHINETKEL